MLSGRPRRAQGHDATKPSRMWRGLESGTPKRTEGVDSLHMQIPTAKLGLELRREKSRGSGVDLCRKPMPYCLCKGILHERQEIRALSARTAPSRRRPNVSR
jgi:hypothetical protein